MRHPVSFSDVGSKWAPVDRRYANDIQAIADAFNASHCNRRDPYPELFAEAGGGTSRSNRTVSRKTTYNADKRAGLGASNIERSGQPPASYRTLNRRSSSTAYETTAQPTTQNQRTAAKFATPALKASTAPKCRVWTASYGGQKAMIIRSNANRTINYTVLDVNKGREDAEAKAYIAAYAKGGRRIGNFASKSAAIDKAFELCPKG